MTVHGFTLFDTAIGRCGIAWGGCGVVGVQLPEAREIETCARVLHRFPDAREAPPPPDVQRALDGIVALLRGEASDLCAVVLDMDRVPPFHRRVYDLARTIPPGTTLSHGDIAARLGARRGASARAKPVRDRRAVPSRARGRRQGRRLLRERRHHDQAPPPLDRRRAGERRARAFRRRTLSIFVALAEAIVYQQLTAEAAVTIFARARALPGLGAARIVREHALLSQGTRLTTTILFLY